MTFRQIVSSITILQCAISAFCTPQSGLAQPVSQEEIVAFANGCNSSRGEPLFAGLGVTIVQRYFLNGKVEREYESSYDNLEKNIWRHSLTVNNETAHGVVTTIRDGDFGFVATQAEGQGAEYGRLGFDDQTHKTLAGSSEWRQVAGVPLEQFVSQPGMEFERVENRENYLGRPVDGVRFRQSLNGMKIHGELYWLPNDGGLLRKVLVIAELPNKDTVSIEDAVIDYQKFNGRLLPAEIRKEFGKGRSLIQTFTDYRKSIEDRNYYSAEALGLKTPTKPGSSATRLLILLVALCTTGIGVYFWKGRRRL